MTPRVAQAQTAGLRTCAAALCLLGWPASASAVPVQADSTFFFDGGQTVAVELYLDTMVIAALPSVAQGELEQQLPPVLQIHRRLDDGMWVLRVTSPLTRSEAFETAAALEAQLDLVVHAAPMARMAGSEVPIGVPTDFLARFHDNVHPDQIDSLNAEHGVTSMGANPLLPGWYRLRATSFDPDPVEVSRTYHTSPLTQWAMPNLLGGAVSTATPNDSLYPTQWHLNNTGQNGGTPGADIGAPAAWNQTTGSTNTVVAVLEILGFDITHPDLVPNLWENASESGLGATALVDDDGNGFVDDRIGWDFRTCPPSTPVSPAVLATCGHDALATGPYAQHGTAMAGLIGARGDNTIGVAGVCWRCRLMLLAAGASIDSKATAFAYARSNGADVVNASWAQLINTPLANAIVDAAVNGRGGLGLPIVFSVFNVWGDECGPPPARTSFASLPEVIAVSQSNNRDERVPDTGFGPCLDLLSPGAAGIFEVGVTTTDITGTPGYNDGDPPTNGCPMTDAANRSYTHCAGGTSASAAVVSGVAALVLDRNPTLSRVQVQSILNSTADKIDCASASYVPPCTPPDPASFSETHGYGRVNAAAAADSAASLPGGGTGPLVVAAATFEMGVRAGVTWSTASSGNRTVAGLPAGGPDGEPALYLAWFPGATPNWMIELQLGARFTSTTSPASDETNVVAAVQPAVLTTLGVGQLYAGANAAIQVFGPSGSTTTDTAIGLAAGYRIRPLSYVALRAEGRSRWWTVRGLTELGLAVAAGVVF